MATKTKGYDVNQVIDVVKMLSNSQGFYGRLLKEILYIKENEPEKFDTFKEVVEDRGFENPVDVVLFFEQ